MPRVSVIDQIPSPLVGEGQGEGPAASAAEEFVTPLSQPSPTRGEGLKHLSLAPEAIDKARYLRRSMTDAERTLWRSLRESFPQARFRRQVPIGRYFPDFLSHSAKLIIEVDGGQHSATLDRDAERTRFLEDHGYRVLRFWNNDVLSNSDGVLERIAQEISRP
jgi:very-short-patch-repair endonuclease